MIDDIVIDCRKQGMTKQAAISLIEDMTLSEESPIQNLSEIVELVNQYY